MHKVLFTLLLVLAICSNGYSQGFLETKWDKYYGGARADAAKDIIEDFDGGITLTGQTKSKTGRKSDLLFLKLSPSGDTRLITNFGGVEDEAGHSMVQTYDGGYVIVGYTESSWAKSKGGKDAWIIKVDEYGEFLWDLICGSSEVDEFNEVVQLESETFIVGGSKGKNGYLVSFDKKGNLLWEKTLTTTSSIHSICVNNDQTVTTVGVKVTGEEKKIVLQKFDLDGNEIWKKAYVQDFPMVGLKVIQNSKQGYCITGIAEQNGTRDDKFLLVTNPNGAIEFLKPYGGRGMDGSRSITETFQGDYLLAGYTGSHERAAKRHKLWLSYLDQNGENKLNKPFYLGGKNQDEANDILQLSDGSFIVAGYSASNKGLEEDAWVIKLSAKDLPSIKVNNDLIKVQLGDFMDENASGTIEKEERAYQTFRVTNDTDNPVYNLEAKIQKQNENKGLTNFQKIKIGFLPANSSKKFSVPFYGERDIQDATNGYELSLNGANDLSKEPLKFEVISTASATPQLKIKSKDFVLINNGKIAKRQEKIVLRIVLENIGNSAAENSGLKFSFPYKVKNLSEKTFKLGTISSGESKTLEFEFEVDEVFLGEEIEIGIRAWEASFKGGAKSKAVIPIESFENSFESDEEVKEQPVIEQNEKGKGGPNFSCMHWNNDDYINIEWITPDIFDTTEFEEASLVFAMKLSLKSSKEVYEEDIQVKVNGEVLPKDKFQIESLQGKGDVDKRYRYAAAIPLVSGLNEIKVIVKNEAGTAETLPVLVTYKPNKSKLFLMSIGVPFDDLNYTAKDANDFASLFSTQDELFSEVNINVLNTKSSTTSQGLKLQLDELYIKYIIEEEITDEDVLILFISSHGLKSSRGKFRVAASDYDLLRMTYTLDYETEILERLDEMECKKLLFIDACYSGAAANSDADVEGAKSGGPDDHDLSKAIASLAESSNDLNTMLSCSAGEKSYENKSWNNGAFTKAIIEAFTGQEVQGTKGKIKADSTEDKIIYFDELYEFVKQRVSVLVKAEFPNKKQTPYVPKEQLESNKPIYVLK